MAHLKLVVDNTNYTPTIIIRPYHKIITVDPEVNPYRKGSKRHENYIIIKNSYNVGSAIRGMRLLGKGGSMVDIRNAYNNNYIKLIESE
jgi:hypothetical protein|tara:strand:- start:235 stop:501 length:267 start_codon:yes stop_codon:yes gene_type:complete